MTSNSVSNQTIGVLLSDLGGPENLSEIPDYLTRFLSDPAILPFPAPLRKAAAFLIAQARKRHATDKYRAIGGKSPLHIEFPKLVEKLQANLGQGFCVKYCFRFASPRVQPTLDGFAREGIKRVIFVPTFPQHSATTAQSCIDEFVDEAKKRRLEYRFTPSFPEQPDYIEALTQSVLDESIGVEAALFVAHGLPVSHIKRGDPYQKEVERTAEKLGQNIVSKGLKRWSLAYQSRLGPVKWLEPYLEHEIQRLARSGVRSLVVVPISFVSENLETRYDLDIEAANLAHSLGISDYRRVKTPGHHPKMIECFASLIKREAT